MRKFFFLLICQLFLLSEANARKIKFTKSPLGQLKIDDRELAWRKPTQTQAQTWVFWAWNGRGTFISVFMISSKFLWVSRFGVQLTIYRKGKGTKYFVRDYTLDRVEASEKVLFIEIDKKHVWSGDQRGGRIKIDFGKWGVKLNYLRTVPGFRTFEGAMVLGNKIFDGIQFAPRLQVKGTLLLDGHSEKFEGIGYADYSFQTIIPKRLARRWYAARGVDREYTVIVSQLLAVRRWSPRSVSSLAIAKGQNWLFISRPEQVKLIPSRRKRELGGYRVPQQVLVKARHLDTQYFLKIKQIEETAKLDLLGHINPLLRFIVGQLLSRPYVFRYKSRFYLKIKRGSELVLSRKMDGYTEWLYVQ